jgi:hypothetical protein
VVVPAGEHRFQNFFFGFNTDYTKPFGGAGHLTWGELWDGHLLKTLYALLYRPGPGVLLSFQLERTDAELEGATSPWTWRWPRRATPSRPAW